jgi:drug/metabolite transporter (DMT)-like permease
MRAMSGLALGLWIANVFLDTVGRLSFKAAAGRGRNDDRLGRWSRMVRTPALWAGIVCFCLEFIAWLALLSLIPLSQAILIGTIDIVAVALAGRLLFRERLDTLRVAGFALIAVGVALAG